MAPTMVIASLLSLPRRALDTSCRAALVIFFLAVATPACVHESPRIAVSPLTPKDIEVHGTATFQATEEKVFQASLDALKVLGYNIAAERKDKGLIITKRKFVGEISRSVRTSQNSATGTSTVYTRQYTLEIKPGPTGSTRVVATPQVFENDVDLSAKPVWVFDGPAGELTFWKQLFTQIQTLL